MLEHADGDHPSAGPGSPTSPAIRNFLEGLARQAGIADAEDFARDWHILMKGSIVAAGEGDQDAARRAKAMAALVLGARSARSCAPASDPRHGGAAGRATGPAAPGAA